MRNGSGSGSPLLHPFPARPVPARPGLLTAEELRVLQELAEGVTPRELAARSGLTLEAVRALIASAQHRLGARTRLHALAMAYELGFLD